MSRKKLMKTIVACLTSVLLVGMAGMSVQAAIVRETEPNNSRDTSQIVEANYETPALAANGKRPDQHMIHGSTSKTDIDWFKIYLTAGTQYVTCNDAAYNFTIYDPNGQIAIQEAYTKNTTGPTGYHFTAPVTGYYFVEISGITSSPSNYIIGVGTPTYVVSSCDVKLRTVNMMNGRDGESEFNLSGDSRLPDDAVVYSMFMSGVRSSVVRSINVENVQNNKNIFLTTYSWDRTGLASLNMPLKSDWVLTYRNNSSGSFSPTIKLCYVYPVLSTVAQNKVIITQ